MVTPTGLSDTRFLAHIARPTYQRRNRLFQWEQSVEVMERQLPGVLLQESRSRRFQLDKNVDASRL